MKLSPHAEVDREYVNGSYGVRSAVIPILPSKFDFTLLGCSLVLSPAADGVLPPPPSFSPRNRFLFAMMGPVPERLALEG